MAKAGDSIVYSCSDKNIENNKYNKKIANSLPNNNPISNSEGYNIDIDKWEMINGFDLFETDRDPNDEINSSCSLEKWLLCGSWTMPFPSHRLDKPLSNRPNNHVKKNDFEVLTKEEIVGEYSSKLIEENMRYIESSCNSSYSDSCESSANSEVYNMNSYDTLKITRLYYDSKEDISNNYKNNIDDSTHMKVRNYIPCVMDENDINSLKILDEKLGDAFKKVNSMHLETKNLISNLSNSMPCLDELMSTTHSLKSNTGKFKSSCNWVMRTAQMDYYKCILFIIFGVGFAIWTL